MKKHQEKEEVLDKITRTVNMEVKMKMNRKT